jgi:glucokinase
MNAAALAIDLGGAHYRAGLAAADKPADLRRIGVWPAPATRDEFLARLAGHLAETGAQRLGLAIPGLAEGTTCRWVPNLAYLDGLDLSAAFRGVEVALGNDAHLALLAEAKAGAAAHLSDAILLAVGTGIGSATLAGGRIVRGGHGGACSFGWAAATLEEPDESRSGWLERVSSGRAFDRIAAGLGLADGVALLGRARAGDPPALEALELPAHALGAALAGAVALLDPEAILFAGGVSASLDVLEPMIRAALVRRLPPHLRGVELRAAHFGADASLIGAAFAGAHGAQWWKARG